MNHEIVFNNNGKKFKLQLLHSVEIDSSVENLVDTAVIVLPESVMNVPLDIETKIGRGTEVSIKLGYDIDNFNDVKPEFTGFITDIVNKNGTLTINCEDALFLFRKSVPDKIFKPAPVKDVLQYLIDKVDPSYKLVMDVDYGVTYEKFIIYEAEAFDVLKKIQEELTVNIFFDTDKKELHFHAPYKEERGKVVYDMSVNIESSALEYKKAADRKIEVCIQRTKTDGTIEEFKYGTNGGELHTIKVGSLDQDSLEQTGINRWSSLVADRYEGTFDTWLIPFVAPTYRAKIKDPDYPDKNANYYVVAVKTTYSDAGAKRTITPGIKL